MSIIRPAAVTVVIVLNLLFATLGIGVLLFSLSLCADLEAWRNTSSPAQQVVGESVTGFRIIAFGVAASRGVVAIGLLVSGFLLLKMHRLGRALAMLAAITSMIAW